MRLGISICTGKHRIKDLKQDKLSDTDIHRNGVTKGIGKPEPFRYRSGYFRRIDETSRLIYDIVDGKLNIASCKGYYDE